MGGKNPRKVDTKTKKVSPKNEELLVQKTLYSKKGDLLEHPIGEKEVLKKKMEFGEKSLIDSPKWKKSGKVDPNGLGPNGHKGFALLRPK